MVKEISQLPALHWDWGIRPAVKSILSGITKLLSSLFFRKLPPPPPQKKYLDCKIPEKLLAPTWKKVTPQARGLPGEGHLSHLREVYISTDKKNVVKISSSVDRKRKGSNNAWPHAERIAYKINKLFHWSVIPKTTILHGTTVRKHQKYASLQRSMTKEALPRVDHLTFTFQSFVQGSSLPHHGARDQKINPDSYQKAYLIDMILGKKDARADNTMYNSKTHELIEVDNESLGAPHYPSNGILRRFPSHRKKKIKADILGQVLSIPLQKIKQLKIKYQSRDLKMLEQWRKENPDSTKTSAKKLESYWNTIHTNFKTLQRSIRKLQNSSKPITIERLEKAYKAIRG